MSVGQAVRPQPIGTTLLDLVFALERGRATSEEELVEIALRLVASERVKLTGIYRDVAPDALVAAKKPGRLN